MQSGHYSGVIKPTKLGRWTGTLSGKTYPASERYQFRQVALLDHLYHKLWPELRFVVSTLPALKTFSIEHAGRTSRLRALSILKPLFRPSGGLISDKFKSRKGQWHHRWIGIGYLLAHNINQSWPIGLAIAVTMFSAYFAQAGCGATYATCRWLKSEIISLQATSGLTVISRCGLSNDFQLNRCTDFFFFADGRNCSICAFLCASFSSKNRKALLLLTMRVKHQNWQPPSW